MITLTVPRKDKRCAVYEIETDDTDVARKIAESVVDTIHSYTGSKRLEDDGPPVYYRWIYSTPQPAEPENPFA
jgi:hypothetical protein